MVYRTYRGKLFDAQYTMLHDFLATNRAVIVDRCRLMAAARSEPKTAEHDLAHGIPVFVDQLITVLASEQQARLCSTNGKHGTATLVVAAIKTGNVGISGATGAVLDRSLLGMRALIDHALAEVRVTARMPPRREAIKLAQFLGNLEVSASFDALARGTPFTVAPVADNIAVYAEPEMLAAAVGNLLQNAFKFTKHHTEVWLRAHVLDDRVLIEVEDRCGGLPDGAVEAMFLPFAQNGDDRSGLGLGLDISRRSVEANGGVLTVRNVPGTGCIFTIDLPRLAIT